jgi:hypothetical protein
MGRAATPLDCTAMPLDWRTAGAIIFTAGGGNPDAIGCFRHLVRREVARLGVLCCSADGPILGEAARHPAVDRFLIEPPTGRDGFLATNTLLASTVVLARAFAEAAGRPHGLPGTLNDFFVADAKEDHQATIRRACRPLLERNTLVVLHGAAAQPAAIDLESKFVEAALGDIQTADYRNFAHGRHHWLAKRADQTAVLALVSEADRDLAERTLSLLPTDIPVVRMPVGGSGPSAAVGALVRGFYVTAAAGERREIDPGDPGVPAFGRRLYHLNAYPAGRRAETEEAVKTVAVERKARTRSVDLAAAGLLTFWSDAYDEFVTRLCGARFGGVVFDYDGTLCDTADRVTGLRPDTADRLVRLLEAGVRVGIATGRGKSVGDGLRAKIPEALWERLLVGYYNGACVGPLSDHTLPDVASPPHEALSALHDTFSRSPVVGGVADLTVRPLQLTLEVRDPAAVPIVWRIVLSACHSDGRVRPVLSTHSIDVLAPGVTKLAVVERVAAGLKEGAAVLCVGDRGEWPGNDYELLRRPLSLSADEPSPEPDAGWNVAPPGVRGAAAAAYYLDRMRVARGDLRIRL